MEEFLELFGLDDNWSDFPKKPPYNKYQVDTEELRKQLEKERNDA